MRYVVTLFWTLILGQMVGFLGAKLTSSHYSFTGTVIASLVVGVVAILVAAIAIPKDTTSKN